MGLDTLNPALAGAIQNAVSAAMKPFRDDVADVKKAMLDGKRPASATGLTPGGLMGMQLPEGVLAAYAGSAGSGMVPKGHRFNKSIGFVRKTDPETQQTFAGRYGDYLKDLWATKRKTLDEGLVTRAGQEEAFARLQAMGVQRLIHESDGGIVKAALAEGSGATGGYTVPPAFLDELVRYAVEPAILWRRAHTIPMGTRSMLVPVLDQATAQGAGISNFLAGMRALWESEAALLGEYEPAFRQVALTAWTLGLISIASIQVLQDNAIGLDGLMTELLTAVIGWTADNGFFNGNGVGQPLGIQNAPALVTVTRDQVNQFSFKDATGMLGALYAGLRQGNQIWVMHQSILPYLLRLNDESGSTANTGRLVFLPSNQGAVGHPATPDGPWSCGELLGRPVYLSEKVAGLGSTGDVVLIDLYSYLIGDRMELEVDVSPHYKFANAQLTWRAIARLDGQPAFSGAITLADGTKTVSGLIALHS